MKKDKKNNRLVKNLTIYLLLFAVVISIASYYKDAGLDKNVVSREVSITQFIQYLEKEDFSQITVKGTTISGMISATEMVYCYVPSSYEVALLDEEYFIPQAQKGVLVYYGTKPDSGFWWNMIPNAIMILSLVFLFWIMMNQGGNGKAFQFGKSRAKMVKGDKKITFKDVAGLEEEKVELEEIVDFLKNPRKYKEVGARIPKGILLVGPPGTGKTYISKAAAGEADVPFFTISGSDFVEMFVGVGASRVRDLFENAKKNAPCIVFIDEIDAVGRKRGSGIGGGHDEREQTLNQLLVEMDGFEENSGIIVLAATNRPDVLDPALLRPGRFDRQVVIGLPDVKGREAIIKVHSKNKPLADDVTPEILAKRTMGCSPADLENILNEAALITARRNGRYIRMEEIEEATRKVSMGPAKKSKVVSDDEKHLTAYHEAGHAVVTRTLPGTMPVHEVTIIPRGRAGGYTMYLPEDDKLFETKKEMFNYICTAMGGRAAEKLKRDDISIGASGDIKQATEIAREMVTKYGFSDILGNVNYGGDGEVFLGNDFTQHKSYSEETAKEIDAEIRRLVKEGYEKAEAILRENDEKLERVAQGLLLVETLDGEQFEALYSGTITPEELKESVKKSEEAKAEKNKEEALEIEKILATPEPEPEEEEEIDPDSLRAKLPVDPFKEREPDEGFDAFRKAWDEIHDADNEAGEESADGESVDYEKVNADTGSGDLTGEDDGDAAPAEEEDKTEK